MVLCDWIFFFILAQCFKTSLNFIFILHFLEIDVVSSHFIPSSECVMCPPQIVVPEWLKTCPAALVCPTYIWKQESFEHDGKWS